MTATQNRLTVLRRAYIDFDGDGFINKGVAQSAPPNLFPNALYASGSLLTGVDGSGNESFTDLTTPSDLGFIVRSVRLGDQALTIKCGFSDYLKWQPHTGDPTNLLTGSLNFQFSAFSQSGGIAQPTANPVASDLVGQAVGAWPYSGTVAPNVFGADNVSAGNHNTYLASGYVAGSSNRYSKAVDATSTINFAGFPAVTPGQTYTLIYYIMPRDFWSSASTTLLLRPRVYGNSATTTTPNFGRIDLGGTDITITKNVWTAVRTVFTIPAGTTKIMLDHQTDTNIAQTMYIGGMMLLSGSVALPTRFWDSSVGYQESQFYYPMTGGQAYLQSFWVSSPNGITKLTPTRHEVDFGSNTLTDTTLSAITVTSTPTRVDFSVPSSANRHGVWWTFTAEKSGVAVDASHAGDVYFTGFMLVAGSTVYPYHAGALYGYDNITDYATLITTKNGKGDFNAPLPDEGTATLTLKNDDKRFSPSNTASPLYGYLNQNLRVIIQIYDITNSVWETVWSGWTANFDVTPGRTSDRSATLECNQGVFRLADGSLSAAVTSFTSMDAIARQVIEASGFRSTTSPFLSTIGIGTLVDENAYMMDTTLMYNVVEPGINVIELSGQDWGSGTDTRKALSDVLESENAMMWINRDGSITIVNRDHWITDATDDTFKLDTVVNSADYVYGQNIINRVETKITRKKQLLAQPVWATKRPVKVNPGQIWTVEMQPLYTEGRVRTVVAYTAQGLVKTVYLKEPGMKYASASVAPQAISDKVEIGVITDAGNRGFIRIRNDNKVTIWIDLTIKGDYVDTGDSILVTVEDNDAQQVVQGVHTTSFTTGVLSDEAQAESYGEFLLLRQAFPHGEFVTFSITVADQADLDRLVDLGVGSIVVLSEIQSMETGIYHAIVSEDFEFGDTTKVTYRAARTLQEDFAKTDVSILADGTANVLPDQTSAATTNGGSVTMIAWNADNLSRLMSWQTGVGGDNQLVLAPARDQVSVEQFTDTIAVPSPTDGSGNPTNLINTVTRLSDNIPAVIGGYSTALLRPPVNFDRINWIGSGTPNTLSTWEIISGMQRDNLLDASVGTHVYTPMTPCLPNAKYLAKWRYFGIATPTHDLLYVMVDKGSPNNITYAAGWSGTGVHGASVRTTEANSNMFCRTVQFRAHGSGSGVGAKDANTIGFQHFLDNTVIGFNLPYLGFISMLLLRYSDNGRISGIGLDTTQAYKYTLYARTAYTSLPVGYTLTVYAEDGSTIGTDAHTVGTDNPTKFEVSIPSGNSYAWATLKKTTDDYLDTQVYIYGFGITAASVSSYLDLLVPQTQDVVFA